MKEILIDSFNLVNIIPTTMLLFAIGYWIIVLFGFIDMNSIDVEIDAEPSLEIEGNESFSDSVSWINNVLIFFNLQHVPLMVFYSVVAVLTWVFSLIISHYLQITVFTFSLVFFIPILLGSLFVAKYLTIPIAKVFAGVEKSRENTNPVGKICYVELDIKPGKMGQGSVKDTNGNVIRLNIIAQANETMHKGTQALVINYSKTSKAFLVEPYNN